MSVRCYVPIVAALLACLSMTASAQRDYPIGCACKDAFKRITMEVPDPMQPTKKRKVEKSEQVQGLLHCNCGKQECVVAAPEGRSDVVMSCTDR